MNPPYSVIKYNDLIESNLREFILDKDFPLYLMMKYHLGWVEQDGSPSDTVARPINDYFVGALSLIVNNVLGGNTKEAIPSALATVLVQNSSFIHQDIQDGTPERNSRPTLWWIWGPAQAINAGDGMHAMGRLALLNNSYESLPPQQSLKAISALDKACLDICEGQFLDLNYTERVDINLENYMQMIGNKNASLVKYSAVLGAISVGSDEDTIMNIAEYGFKLGLSMKIRNDILDLWQRDHKSGLSGDILGKKKLLPIVYALQNAKGIDKHTLGDIYFKRSMENKDIELLLDVLDSIGAKQYTQGIADSLMQESMSCLANLNIDEEARNELANVATYFSIKDI
jgi:geranylgeranyl diphosphate synthase type I